MVLPEWPADYQVTPQAVVFPKTKVLKDEIISLIEWWEYTGPSEDYSILEWLYYDAQNPEVSKRKIENILRLYTVFNKEDGATIKQFNEQKREEYPLDMIMRNGEEVVIENGEKLSRENRLTKSLFEFSWKELTQVQIDWLLVLHEKLGTNYKQFEMSWYTAGKYLAELQSLWLTKNEAIHLTDSGILWIERFFSKWWNMLILFWFYWISASVFGDLSWEEQITLFAWYMTLESVFGTMWIDEMTGDDTQVTKSYIWAMYWTWFTSLWLWLLTRIAQTWRFDDIPWAENLSEVPLQMSIPIVFLSVYNAYKKYAWSLQSTEWRGFTWWKN
jgi:hypothetical protein